MTCITDRCGAALGCSSHARLVLEVTPAADAALAERLLDALAEQLSGTRAAAPRDELVACGRLLAARFTPEADGGADALRLDRALTRDRGAPLVLGALAATAARRAGIPLGLLVGPYGRLAVAHATLAEPLVLDVGAGFALTDIAGDEPLHRWLCAHETARRLSAALTAPAPRAAAPKGPRARPAVAVRRTTRRALQPHA